MKYVVSSKACKVSFDATPMQRCCAVTDAHMILKLQFICYKIWLLSKYLMYMSLFLGEAAGGGSNEYKSESFTFIAVKIDSVYSFHPAVPENIWQREVWRGNPDSRQQGRTEKG